MVERAPSLTQRRFSAKCLASLGNERTAPLLLCRLVEAAAIPALLRGRSKGEKERTPVDYLRAASA
jgi:hypothetical protein